MKHQMLAVVWNDLSSCEKYNNIGNTEAAIDRWDDW